MSRLSIQGRGRGNRDGSLRSVPSETVSYWEPISSRCWTEIGLESLDAQAGSRFAPSFGKTMVGRFRGGS